MCIRDRYKGAQPPEYIAKPSVEQFKHYQQAARGHIRYVTLAPEHDEGFALTHYPVSYTHLDVYKRQMLGIPMELYTPLFAVARVMGWSAHRIEELLSANKIIRPAYKSLGGTHDYIPRSQRA